MERTELEYLADFLASSFTELGLMHDYQILAERGSGTITIDARRGTALCDGKPWPELMSAARVASLFRLELDRDPLVALQDATLKVKFATERYREQRKVGTKWTHPTDMWIGATFDSRSWVRVAGQIATASHSDQEEWPYPLRLESDWLRQVPSSRPDA